MPINKLLSISSWVWITNDLIHSVQFAMGTEIGIILSTLNLPIWPKKVRKRYRILWRCEVIFGWNIIGRYFSRRWGSILLIRWIVRWNYLGRSQENPHLILTNTCAGKRLWMYTKVPFRGVSIVMSHMVMGTSFCLMSSFWSLDASFQCCTRGTRVDKVEYANGKAEEGSETTSCWDGRGKSSSEYTTR